MPAKGQSYGAPPNLSAKQSHAAGVGIHWYQSHQALSLLRWKTFSKKHVIYTRKQQIAMAHFGAEEGPSRPMEVAA